VARSRILAKLNAGDWVVNLLGGITVPGSGTLDIAAYFTDEELAQALQNGLAAEIQTGTPNKVLRIDDGAGSYDIDTAAKAAPFYNIVQPLVNDQTSAAHNHADAAGGAQFAGLSAMTDVANSIGAEAKVMATDAAGQVSLSVLPTSANHLANKVYVDDVAQGLSPKTAVRLATAGVLPACTPAGSGVGKTLTADVDGILSVDGVEVNNADRILVKNQADASDNGIYVVTDKGSLSGPWILTRATDFDGVTEVKCGSFMYTSEGATNNNYRFVLTTPNPITVETSDLVFSVLSGPDELEAGDGINIASGIITTKNGNGLEYGSGGDAGKNQVKVDVTTGATVAPVSVGANGVGVNVDDVTIKHTGAANYDLYVDKVPTKGQKVIFAFGRASNIPDAAYLRSQDGVFANVSSYRMLRACKVTGISAQLGTAGTTIDFEVHKNGAVLDASVDIALGAANGAVETDVTGSFVNNTLAINDVLSVYALNITGNPKDAVVYVEVELTA